MGKILVEEKIWARCPLAADPGSLWALGIMDGFTWAIFEIDPLLFNHQWSLLH